MIRTLGLYFFRRYVVTTVWFLLGIFALIFIIDFSEMSNRIGSLPGYTLSTGLLVTALAAVILIFVVLTWYAALFGIAVWLVAVAALRMMAKADPLMRRVYIRHISYKTFYRATSSPWRRY